MGNCCSSSNNHRIILPATKLRERSESLSKREISTEPEPASQYIMDSKNSVKNNSQNISMLKSITVRLESQKPDSDRPEFVQKPQVQQQPKPCHEPRLERLHSFKSIPIHSRKFINISQGNFLDNYKFIEELGQGSTGTIILVEHRKTGLRRAIKTIYKASMTAEEADRMFYEFNIIKNLDHPNILKLYEVIEDRTSYHIVTEYYTGGELFTKIVQAREFNEYRASEIAYQILTAMKYCHVNHVVHRDLKPENVLFQTPDFDSPIAIIDFGTSRYYSPQEAMEKRVGTLHYLAPEVFQGKYDKKCDVWSCGVMLYIMLCGWFPFYGDTEEKAIESICLESLSWDLPQWDQISQEARDLLEHMMNKDAAQRYTIEDWLAHSWIQNRARNPDCNILSASLGNIVNNRASKKLEQAALSFISNHLTTMNETQEIKKAFSALDKDGNGMISREELQAGIATMDHLSSLGNVDDIFYLCDTDGSGLIDYNEFIAAAIDRKNMLSKKKLESAFDMFDRDKSGKISVTEFKELISGEEKLAEDEEWVRAIAEVDTNGDGEIDLDEFKTLLTLNCQ